MYDFSGLQLIVGIISTLTTGGILGSLVGLRYLKSKEKAKAKQEIEQAASLELANVKNLIDLYNEALESSKKFQNDITNGYETKISQLEDMIKDYRNRVEDYSNLVRVQESTINKLTRVQLGLKMQLQSLTQLNSSDCDTCQFRDTCEKYKAKQLLNEQVNAEDLLSTK